MTWGWLNNDRFLIFGRIIPLGELVICWLYDMTYERPFQAFIVVSPLMKRNLIHWFSVGQVVINITSLCLLVSYRSSVSKMKSAQNIMQSAVVYLSRTLSNNNIFFFLKKHHDFRENVSIRKNCWWKNKTR